MELTSFLQCNKIRQGFNQSIKSITVFEQFMSSKNISSHSVKCIRVRSFFGLFFPAFSPYSVQMRENKDQKNLKDGHFSRRVAQYLCGLFVFLIKDIVFSRKFKASVFLCYNDHIYSVISLPKTKSNQFQKSFSIFIGLQSSIDTF